MSPTYSVIKATSLWEGIRTLNKMNDQITHDHMEQMYSDCMPTYWHVVTSVRSKHFNTDYLEILIERK